MQRVVRAGLIGFGTIGTGVVKVLRRNRRQIAERLGADLQLTRIADIDTKTDRGVRVGKKLLVSDASKILDDPSIDVVIELVGGYTVARRFIMDAIGRGKGVVTANKALLAEHGTEIFRAAERAGVHVGFEASVGGGIPIVRTLRDALGGDRSRAVYGIVNGTSNYILSRMTSDGGEFAEVVADAQRAGLAEADPSFDVDGIDASHKLALLIQLAFGARVRLADIATTGIRQISQLDIEFARDFGYVIKPLAIARDAGQHIEARVHPTMVPRHHVLADVNDALNAVVVRGDALEASMYVGLGAGMMPTATAVVADLMDVARGRLGDGAPRTPPLGYPVACQRRARVKPPGQVESRYYLRFMVVDRPGVLARIAAVLGRANISIASVLQKNRRRGAAVPIVIRTHHARARDLHRALRAIDKLPVVLARSTFIHLEESPES